MSKTASLCVFRYSVKIFFTSGFTSLPASLMACSTMRQPPFGIILVLIMIFRPQGLFGARNHLLAYGKKAKRVAARLRKDAGRPVEEAAS